MGICDELAGNFIQADTAEQAQVLVDKLQTLTDNEHAWLNYSIDRCIQTRGKYMLTFMPSFSAHNATMQFGVTRGHDKTCLLIGTYIDKQGRRFVKPMESA